MKESWGGPHPTPAIPLNPVDSTYLLLEPPPQTKQALCEPSLSSWPGHQHDSSSEETQ